ncbi:MAG: cytochrome c oxidase subunit 3 [Planctomycetota bacterium]|nr:cytochrome c oxidase subunit 3 [Planctomycetota bacterium]MCX8039867.1 cytochrome c oxidase subunit 3 [Planctomycetota bacterium]MDW8372174.1 cytochrome c oxidase subunit 3 [Planctomycetota bacterium]
MSASSISPPDRGAEEHGAGHDHIHLPPPSIWPLVTALGLTIAPFGVVSLLGGLSGWPLLGHPSVGLLATLLGLAVFLVGLMAWAHQNIVEKPLAHDPIQQQKDLQLFVLLFLVGELAAFGAIFGYLFYMNAVDPSFGPPRDPDFPYGGPLAAIATFLLLSSSVTGEFAHHAVTHGRFAFARLMLVLTLILGAVFLACQGFEWGEFIQRGFTPLAIPEGGMSSFAAAFYTGTGFHGLHVAIGLVLLFLAWMRMEAGAYRDGRTFSMTAASWYWHFVDIVWVLLFITLYVFS